MQALKANYAQNIKILKINLARGMAADQANKTINAMQKQFIDAGLYGPDEEQYINEMRAAVASHFLMVDIVLN